MNAPPAASAILTVLGSGTLVPSALRASASHHLMTDTFSLLVDCGPGTLHGLPRHGVDWEGLTHVALSHFHNDHVADLAGLLVAFRHGALRGRTAPLTLLGPKGLDDLFEALVGVHGEWLREPGLPLDFIEVGPKAPFRDDDRGLDVSFCATGHTENSLALRVQGAWGSFVYTGDTGPNADVAAFAAGAGVLISECNHSDPPKDGHHLSPVSVAEMAATSRPELLVVTHVAPPQTPEEAVEQIRTRYEGRCIPGSDGLRVRITQGAVAVDPPGRAV